jgi:hypothetical protein
MSLLSRLGALTGPDREVDAEIALACGWTKGRWRTGIDDWRSPSGQICPQPPRYTESLDAIEPLAAEFYYLFAKGKTRPDEPLYGVQLMRPDDKHWVIAEAEHDLPSVALLIAIMKAKEESKP